MGGLVPKASVPTSAGAVKRGIRGSFGTATGVMWLVLGVGLFLFALPWLSRIPILGGLIQSGVSVLPGQAGKASATDEFGTMLRGR